MTTENPTFKPKKSVALSGVAAGNTALCTVGRSGNDLSYRGYDILDLAKHCEFEEVAHLLIHGHLPNKHELAAYKKKLQSLRNLPANVLTVLESLPANAHPMDVMRTGVSALGCTTPERESHPVSEARDIADKLIASFGSMLLYWYQYAHNGKVISLDSEEDSIGGHFLHLLHGKRPSESHIKAMHISLILYAEHEFNASTFTSRVIAGTGSDLYSSITGAIGALKGPKHGGANIKVVKMFNDMRKHVHDYSDEEEISAYLKKLLHKEAFDKRGLIYGMGHAIYSVSDPRAEVFKGYVEQLAREKGRMKDYQLYAAVERLAPKVIAEERKIYKGVSANVDFYSGFVYSMLDLPLELYTPMFAIARIVGWSAHRMEELINVDKIIRPAYKNVLPEAEYIPLCER